MIATFATSFLRTCSTRFPLAAGVVLALAGLLLAEAAQAQGQPSVQTARLDTVWQFPQRSAHAQVLARNESRLSAEVAGTVTRWSADVGTNVRRGDVLVQIDPKDYELALQRAEAALAAARARLHLGEAQLQRARELVAQGFFSQEALAQRQTEVALQQADLASTSAQLDAARRQLAKTTVRAPFNGTVVQRTVQLGEAVGPGAALLTLAETGAAEVQAHVSPLEVDGLRRAQTLQFQPQDSADNHPLRLLRVTATVQAGSRTQAVRLAFAAPSVLPPGTSGLLLWSDPAPHIPASLVVRRAQALGVFVRDGATARFVPLTGAQEGRPALTRLSADTQIVVRGQAALTDGKALAH